MAELNSFPSGDLEVTLDGVVVEIPPERRSFTAIRSYLDALALQQQRILCSLNLDGEAVNLTQPPHMTAPFAQVEAETMSLHEVPTQLIKAAIQQAATIQTRLQKAVELVLINDSLKARELWWSLSTSLKEPLLTLSLVPDHFQPSGTGGATVSQLRKWQLQQLGCIMQDIEIASQNDDTAMLSEALESRALPWIEKLLQSLNLWHESLLSAARSNCHQA